MNGGGGEGSHLASWGLKAAVLDLPHRATRPQGVNRGPRSPPEDAVGDGQGLRVGYRRQWAVCRLRSRHSRRGNILTDRQHTIMNSRYW